MSTKQLRNLSIRPTYTRQVSTESTQERGSGIPLQEVRTNTPAPAEDTFEPQSRVARTVQRMGAKTMEASQETLGHLKPHWRDITLGAALTGMLAWLIVITTKVNELSSLPFCEDLD